MATINTNKLKTTRKSTKSAMPLKKKFRVNKWVALGLVAVLAGIGVYIVQRSSASSYTFVLGANAREIQNGQIQNKNGTPYRVVSSDYNKAIYMYSIALPSATKQVCSHVKAIDKRITIQLEVYVGNTPSRKQITLNKGQTGNLCVNVRSYYLAYFNAAVTPYSRGTIGVSSFYGLAN